MGEAWLEEEATMHIKCLELLAAMLASGRSSLKGTSYLDKEPVDMVLGEEHIHITAQHLPGAQNVIADAESQTVTDRTD